MKKLIVLLILIIQMWSIHAIVESRWSQFKAPVEIQGCTRIEGGLEIDKALKFGPDFVANPIDVDPRFVYDPKQNAALEPTIWVQVCEPIGTETPQRYRETFRFDGANGGVQAQGYKLIDTTHEDYYQDACLPNQNRWIITPWGAWGGRDTNIKGYKGIEGDKGERGIQGLPGPTGPTGVNGVDGTNGANGDTGETGPTGPTGPNGFAGNEGPQGATGPVGPTGVQGQTGPTGPTGPTGDQGIQGPVGESGEVGQTGVTGPVGATGATGVIGATGVVGETGPTGLTGATGAIGETGVTGPDGPTGVQGDVGVTGAQGPTGDDGLIGETGPTGFTGVQGGQGFTGVQGDAGLIGDTGATGLIGSTGLQGPVGPVGDLGPTGAIGDLGPSGAAGPQGSVGVTGATGANGIDATSCQTLDFYYLYRSVQYIQNFDSNTQSGSLTSRLSFGRLNTTISVAGSSTSSIKRAIHTPYCTKYCSRVLLGGYGIWSRSSLEASTLNARTLSIHGGDFNTGANGGNHYYWVLPSTTTSGIELVGPQNSPLTALGSRLFRCQPPSGIVGWVTTFIPRSSADVNNLSNRCLAYVRIDFEGRVHAYKFGTCSPVFNNGGSFDYFTHLNFNGLSYVPGMNDANNKVGVQGIPYSNLAFPVANPAYYTVNILQITDDNGLNNFSNFRSDLS